MESKNNIIVIIVAVVAIIAIIIFRKPIADLFKPSLTTPNMTQNNTYVPPADNATTRPETPAAFAPEPTLTPTPAPEPTKLPVTGVDDSQ
jgi:hypothetical protein